MNNNITKEVQEFTKKSMREIESELDLAYCKENDVMFSNNEVDTMSIDLYSKESTDVAYEILHPKN